MGQGKRCRLFLHWMQCESLWRMWWRSASKCRSQISQTTSNCEQHLEDQEEQEEKEEWPLSMWYWGNQRNPRWPLHRYDYCPSTHCKRRLKVSGTNWWPSYLGNRCPCFSAGRSCVSCGCKNCNNPNKKNGNGGQNNTQIPTPMTTNVVADFGTSSCV